MHLRIKKLNPQAQVPERGSQLAAGYDLYSTENTVILPTKRAVVGTGISIEMPEGVYGRIAPRSGLAVKHGIHVGAGVIDRDYTGELKVVLFNLGNEPYIIKPGYRIAQLILEKHMTVDVEEVHEMMETQRGDGGFGSTGQ